MTTWFILGSEALGHGTNVLVSVSDGRLVTGSYDFESDALIENVRVFDGAFALDPLDPWYTDAPGFSALPNSGLASGTAIGFDILSDLLYWDGTGPVQLGPPPGGETLRINLTFSNAIAGAATGFVPGYNIATAAANGAFHRHLNYLLERDAGDPAVGVYVVQLRLRATGGIEDAAPVWLVFNNGLDTCPCEAARAYVQMHLAGTRSRADLDGDGRVDGDDLEMMTGCRTGPAIAVASPCCQVADIDRDGDVDQDDFGLWQRCRNGVGPADPQCD